MEAFSHTLNYKTALRWVLMIFLATLVGNSFWDFLAKPGLGRISTWIVESISSLSKGYTNYIYSTASTMANSSLDGIILLAALVSPIIIIFFVFGIIELNTMVLGSYMRYSNEISRKAASWTHNRSSKSTYWTIGSIAIFLIIYASLVGMTNLYSMSKYDAMIRQITIISPFIDDKETKTIHAKIVLIKTKDDYIKIQNMYRDIAMKNGIPATDLELEFVEPY